MTSKGISINRPRGFRTVVILLVLTGIMITWMATNPLLVLFQLSSLDIEEIYQFDETTKMFGPATGIILEPLFDLLGWLYLSGLIAIFNFSMGLAITISAIEMWRQNRWAIRGLIILLSIQLLISILTFLDIQPFDFWFVFDKIPIAFYGFMLFYLGRKKVRMMFS